MKRGKCKNCGATILWARLKSGKWVPVQPVAKPFFNDNGGTEMILEGGHMVCASIVKPEHVNKDTKYGFVSHIGKCHLPSKAGGVESL